MVDPLPSRSILKSVNQPLNGAHLQMVHYLTLPNLTRHDVTYLTTNTIQTGCIQTGCVFPMSKGIKQTLDCACVPTAALFFGREAWQL